MQTITEAIFLYSSKKKIALVIFFFRGESPFAPVYFDCYLLVFLMNTIVYY